MSKVHRLMRCLACCGLTLLAGACGSTAAPEGPAPDLLGTWSYTAVQAAPATTVSGTLVISVQNGHNFSGQLKVVETDMAGVQRQRAGVVSGLALSSTSVDFDAYLDLSSRRHVGRIAGDSIAGSWVDEAGSDGTVAGTFRLHRSQMP